MRKILWVSLMIGSISQSVMGQPNELAEGSLSNKLLPLDVLVKAAWENSYLLKEQEELFNIKTSQVKIQKRNWTQYISGVSTINYGKRSSLSDIESSASNYYQLTNNQNLQYNMGVSIRIPLKSILSSKEQIKVKKSEVKRAVHQKGFIKQQLKLQIIELCNRLLLAEEFLEIRAEAKQSSHIAFEVSEQFFREGNISVTEFDKVFNLKVRSEENYQKSKSELALIYSQLTEITGIRILK